MAFTERQIKLYDKLVASVPGVERKGKTMPYTAANGHMFSIITKEGNLGIRLPKEERLKFIEKYDSKIIETYGRNMPEYVEIPDHMLEETELLSGYLKISYNYIISLKPK